MLKIHRVAFLMSDSQYTRSSPSNSVRFSKNTKIIWAVLPVTCFSLAAWQFSRYQYKSTLKKQLLERRAHIIDNADITKA